MKIRLQSSLICESQIYNKVKIIRDSKLKTTMKQNNYNNNKLHQLKKQEVILTAATLPREYSPRVFKRRQDLKSKQIQSPERKRKDPPSLEKDPMCYISMMNLRKSNTDQTSLEKRTNQQKNTKQKKQTLKRQKQSSSSPDLNKIEQRGTRNSRQKFSQSVQPKIMIEKQKKLIDKQVLQITELKQINKILNSEITLLKNHKETQTRVSQDLQQKISQLTFQLKDSTKTIKSHEKEITRLRNILNSNKLLLQQYETKNNEDSREDLQKILYDINKEIDQIFIDEVSVDRTHSPPKHEEAHDLDEFHKKNLNEVVYELQSKIKYLEIEVAMLKKYKLDYERMEKQWMIANNQLKSFKKKLILLAHQTQVQNNSNGLNMKKITSSKTPDEMSDSSISLQFSKDSNLQKIGKI